MLQTLLGLILLLSPILIIFKCKNKRFGFVSILSFLIIFHLALALVTQSLHVFTYPVILLFNIVLLFLLMLRVNFKEVFINIKQKAKEIDLILVFVMLVAFICLFSLHYDYSGKTNTATAPGYQEAKHMEYPYPYFSDEWYSIAFIKDAIESQSLPLKNPLSPGNRPFTNLEFAFHSFLAELVLLLNLNPLTDYTLLTLFFGLLTVALVYFFLRENRINQLPAAIASLSLLYITNGANLPGIWNLLPLNLGIIWLLLSLFFIATKKTKMAILASIVSPLFYPPLIPFSALAVISYIILKKRSSTIQNVY